ncbi:MAG: hypothetical protein DRH37_07965 [Deltaproteobacteria bacterium]|nr:MAG: hypothetical protein DRH37_07965 [Deltaproteobacteria bacterium]
MYIGVCLGISACARLDQPIPERYSVLGVCFHGRKRAVVHNSIVKTRTDNIVFKFDLTGNQDRLKIVNARDVHDKPNDCWNSFQSSPSLKKITLYLYCQGIFPVLLLRPLKNDRFCANAAPAVRCISAVPTGQAGM